MEDDLQWKTTFDGTQPLMEYMTFNARPPTTLIGKKTTCREISRFRSAIYRRCGHFFLQTFGGGLKTLKWESPAPTRALSIVGQ